MGMTPLQVDKIFDKFYSDDDIHRAIQISFNTFLAETKLVTEEFQILTVAGQDYVDLTDVKENFRPELLNAIYLSTFSNIRVVNFQEISYWLEDNTEQSEPVICSFNFNVENTGDNEIFKMHLAPIPDQQYTLTISWMPPLRKFQAGTTQDLDLNIPDYAALEVAATGAVGFLQMSDPEHAKFSQNRMGEFREVIERYKGKNYVRGSVRKNHPITARLNSFRVDRPGSRSFDF